MTTETHLASELQRCESLGVIAPMVKKASHALQFPRKRDAESFAKQIGWPLSSAWRVKVLGFRLWVLADGQLRYLTAREALRLLNDRFSYTLLRNSSMSSTDRAAAAEAAAQWEAAAAREIQMADYYDSIGNPYGDTSSYRRRAEADLRTARILRLEAETGKRHCSICFGDHPNHLHRHGRLRR